MRSHLPRSATLLSILALSAATAGCPVPRLDDDDTAGDDDAGDDDVVDDDDATLEEVPECAIRLESPSIMMGDVARIEVRLEPECMGQDWELDAWEEIEDRTITIQATWRYRPADDDDGWCCGENRTVPVWDLEAGAWTVEAACWGTYAQECADEFGGGDGWGGTASLQVILPDR